MLEVSCVDLSALEIEQYPFPHFYKSDVLIDGLERELYEWFEQAVDWDFTATDFYTQYEVSLLEVDLPAHLRPLRNSPTITAIEESLRRVFKKDTLELVGITAHKLIDGHKIGVHNDFIEGEETHRLIIQINPSWTDENGGFLMLFTSPSAADVVRVIQPLNNTAFAFEISPTSYHAVSTVYNYSRYTLVYTFKEQHA